MFTVIIPTMWLNPNFIIFLEDILNHPKVGEVLIIDNNPDKRPLDNILFHYKIRILSKGYNIFVNPAWNLGVEKAVFEKICILTDSFIFDLKIFDKVSPYITENLSIVGMNCTIWGNGLVNIRKFEGGSVSEFFRCFFIHKKNWINIPDLKIYFGDNFIWDSCILNQKDIFVIENLFCHIENGSSTSKLKYIEEIFESDKNIYRKILRKWGVNPKTFSCTHFGTDI